MMNRKENILFIHEHVDQLSKRDRVEMLSKLIEFIGEDKIVEKGMGTQIRYSDLKDDILDYLQQFIAKTLDLK
jgi:hypothetical protein